MYHQVPNESVRQTVERNYYKCVAPQNQTPTPWSYNTAQSQNNNVQQLKMPAGSQQQLKMPSYELQQQLQQQTYTSSALQPKPSVWNGVPTALATGFVDGTFGAVERFVNGLTTGAYGYGVDQFLNNAYSNRQNRLKNQADQAGVGYAHDLANRLVDGSSLAIRYILKGK